MDIQLEKFHRLLKDLDCLRYPDEDAVSHYKIMPDLHAGSAALVLDTSNWFDYQVGAPWGKRDQHCWFRTAVEIPLRFSGKNVIFAISTGHAEGWDISNPQFLIYLNGKMVQGLDVNHKNTRLSEHASDGENYQITLLGYSGFNDEAVILKSYLKVVDPLIEDFYYNLSNLFWSLCILDPKDEKSIDLMQNLNKVVGLLDMRKEYSDSFYEGIRKANQWLIERYFTTIREDGPVVTTLGHTHIDIAWLWTINQTKEKVVRSFQTVLELMSIYPEYTFMSSQPQLYVYIKENAPEIYEQIKVKVKEGRWEVDGGMWLEADCNIPSGESLARQLLYGISFFQKEFNQRCTTLWLPDVFGYSAALPQLIKKSGLSYMMTTKLDWNQSNKIPHDTFMWRGIDGSEVLTHLITTTDHMTFDHQIYQRENPNQQTTYNGRLNPNQVLGTWSRYQDKLLSDETLQIFGFGDGGGGPTEQMLENYKRLKYGLPGIPRVKMDQQRNFFSRLMNKAKTSPHLKKWQGELYLEFHRGTYTSMAKNKRFNRKAEFLYQDLEFYSTIAKAFHYKYPKEFIERSWKQILLYQFHDIIPGSSIKQVYEETDVAYEKLLREGEKFIHHTLGDIVDGLRLAHEAIVVFNTLSHTRTDLVALTREDSRNLVALQDNEGVKHPVQGSSLDEHIYFLAENIPSKGYKVFQCIYESENSLNDRISYDDETSSDDIINSDDKINSNQIISMTEDQPFIIQSRYYQLSFNTFFELISIFDLINQREILSEGKRGNVLQIFEDRPAEFENWNIDYTVHDKTYEIQQVEAVQVIQDNELGICLEILRKYEESTIKQQICLYHHHPRIDFKTEVDWHEKNVLLKAAFDVDINSTQATYEIQYGNVIRPTHENTSWDVAQFEVCGHKWADLSETGYGVSLMNDCKYGYDIKNGRMRITLIKCGTYPNPEADQGHHVFTYSLYGHSGSWQEAKTQELALELNVPLRYHRTNGKNSLKDAQENAASFSFAQISLNNVILDTIKEQEAGEDTILRLYEFKNIRSTGYLKTFYKLQSVQLCDLIENTVEPMVHDEYGFQLSIKGYEVLTLLLKFER